MNRRGGIGKGNCCPNRMDKFLDSMRVKKNWMDRIRRIKDVEAKTFIGELIYHLCGGIISSI